MSEEKKEFSMGGQAVLEGVMMNGPAHYAASVRRSDGVIVSSVVDHHSKTEGKRFLSLPVIRGAVRFVESLVMGIEVLDFSAEIFAAEEETAKTENGKKNEALENILIYGVGILLCVGLFIVLPVLVSKWLLRPFISAPWLLTICEGVMRLLIFLIYMLAVSRVKDTARTFEYHGAEHKVVACYEAGEALTVENARTKSRLNKRCGTSFIFIIMVFSIILFMFIPVSQPVFRILLKLLLLPVMAGISYEILKFSAKSESKLMNALVAPGLWFQRISTKEPDERELEVALCSAILILECEGLPLPEGTEPIAHELYRPKEEAAKE